MGGGLGSEVGHLSLHQLGYPATPHELFIGVLVHRSVQDSHVTPTRSVQQELFDSLRGRSIGRNRCGFLSCLVLRVSFLQILLFTLPTAAVASFTSSEIVFAGVKTIPVSTTSMAYSSSSSNVASGISMLATGPSFCRNPHLEKHLEIVLDCT